MHRYAFSTDLAISAAGAASLRADVVVPQPETAMPLTLSTTPAVLVPVATAAPGPVVVLTPGAPAPQLEREGDWYVVSGTADPDRFHSILRVKDEKQGWVTLAYRDGVKIYRRGEHINYSDVNLGDTVTVRFKAS